MRSLLRKGFPTQANGDCAAFSLPEVAPTSYLQSGVRRQGQTSVTRRVSDNPLPLHNSVLLGSFAIS
ncbi:hypothetical protein [Nostoc sp.]|uniref:hypothetical protein n=1 Tax=Nostoc sp. TaxID=1180 RepID=UPI002FF59AD7